MQMLLGESVWYLGRVCLQRRALPYVDALTPSSHHNLDKKEAAANAAKAPVSEMESKLKALREVTKAEYATDIQHHPLSATAAGGVFHSYSAERDLRGEASTLSAAAAAVRVQGAFRGRRARECARQVHTHTHTLAQLHADV
jgi:hypothetical protein